MAVDHLVCGVDGHRGILFTEAVEPTSQPSNQPAKHQPTNQPTKQNKTEVLTSNPARVVKTVASTIGQMELWVFIFMFSHSHKAFYAQRQGNDKNRSKTSGQTVFFIILPKRNQGLCWVFGETIN